MQMISSPSAVSHRPIGSVLICPRGRRSSPRMMLQGRNTLREHRQISVRASGDSVDFDKVLSDIADKFEKSDNKAAIIGYSFAAFFALWFAEWFIHLPVLDFLLGGPVQLLGLAFLPYLGVKYFVDDDSITGDASKAFDRVVNKLPGLKK